jgi:hypothetical protein
MAKRDSLAEAFERLSRAVQAVAHALVRTHPSALTTETQFLVDRLVADAEAALNEEK